MTKTQKEAVIAAVLSIILVFLAWNNLFRDRDRGRPEPPAPRYEEIPLEIPAPPETAPAPVAAARPGFLELQAERALLAWGPDPFREIPAPEPEPGPEPQPGPEPEPAPPEDTRGPELPLRGIAQLNGARQALIGTEIVSEGDVIHGYEIISIGESSLILRRKGKEYEIRINR